MEESKEVISITPEQQKMLDEIKAEAKIDYEKSKTNAKLEILFSSWDGSLPSFVDYIKENMNDPDSFDHVETTFRNDSDGMTVRMKYRGKNGFNATVTQTATCKVDYEGNFLYLISNN